MSGTTRAAAYALYKDDHAYHDGVEDVTYTPPTGAAVASVKAKLELPAETLTQLGEGAADRGQEAKWVLWDATLGGTVVQENGTITRGNGEVWRVKSHTRELWDTQWHCQTRKDR